MADAQIPPPLKTKEEALNWLISLVERAENARIACDVPLAVAAEAAAAEQFKAWQAYLMAHGQALGAIGYALRKEDIDVVAYNKLVQRVRVTLLPTNVGSLQLGAQR